MDGSDQLLIKTEMYNITSGTTATKGNELGIFEGVGDVYAQEDLNLFFSTLARYVPVLLLFEDLALIESFAVISQVEHTQF
jgi:hypothetical protein